jgi:DNA mismatch repair protein MutS
MGARLLKRWLLLPLKDILKINERLNAVEYLILHTDLRKQLQQLIKQCGDIERLVSKIPSKKINPRDVMHLAKGLQFTGQVKTLCAASGNDYLKRLSAALNPCNYIAEKYLRK